MSSDCESIEQAFNRKAKQAQDDVSPARKELEPDELASKKRVDALKASVPQEWEGKDGGISRWKSWTKFISWVRRLDWPTGKDGEKVVDPQISGWLNEMINAFQNTPLRHEHAAGLMVGLSEKDPQDPSMPLVSRVGEIRAIFKESDGKLSRILSLQGQIMTRLAALAQAPPGDVASGPRLGGKPRSTIRVESDFDPMKV